MCRGLIVLSIFQINYQHNLIEVHKEQKEAMFELVAEGKEGETISVEVAVETKFFLNIL